MPPTPTIASRRIRQSVKLAFPFTVTIGCLWLLHTRVQLPDLATLTTLVTHVPSAHWLLAVLATGLSFWALGRYDIVAHRHIGTGFAPHQVRRSGMAAIALSQTLGFGLVTGSYARWKLLPGLSGLKSLQVTVFVAISFLAALACVGALAALLLPVDLPIRLMGLGGVALALAFAGFSFVHPQLRLGSLTATWPSLTAMAALVLWTAVDVCAAGAALWALLPGSLDISYLTLLPVFMVALAVAILSSAPGGVGPFELTMVSLMPQVDPAALVGAILAFRLVYYALPAVAALLVLALPSGKMPAAPPLAHPAIPLPFDRQRSETMVALQNGGRLRLMGSTLLAILPSRQTDIALFDPLRGSAADSLQDMQAAARGRNATTCIYKCTARTAAAVRSRRWVVLRIAQEAVISPGVFDDTGSCHRQLRRKLRQATKAGVTVLPAADSLPLSQMSSVDQAWQQAHGAARGTTMGRYEPGYLSHQQLFLAWHGGRVIGFVSFHTAQAEWCLDLVRLMPAAPDGTGHLLIRKAIETAAEFGVPRLSLAAAPDHRLAHRLDGGLRRFKASFSPQWQPLYLAAPTWWDMAVSIAELILMVHRPAPVVDVPAFHRIENATPAMAVVHNEDEQNEFAMRRPA